VINREEKQGKGTYYDLEQEINSVSTFSKVQHQIPAPEEWNQTRTQELRPAVKVCVSKFEETLSVFKMQNYHRRKQIQ